MYKVKLTLVATLSNLVQKQLLDFAIAGYPYEVCGLIHEHGIVHQYYNTFFGDKTTGFDFEFDISDPTIKAIWHSHPRGLEQPSHDDLPCIQSILEHGYTFNHIIVTPRRVIEYKAELVDTSAPAA